MLRRKSQVPMPTKEEGKKLTCDLQKDFVLLMHTMQKKDALLSDMEKRLPDVMPFKAGDIVSSLPCPMNNNLKESGLLIRSLKVDKRLTTYTDIPHGEPKLILVVDVEVSYMATDKIPKDVSWVASLTLESDGRVWYHSHVYTGKIIGQYKKQRSE